MELLVKYIYKIYIYINIENKEVLLLTVFLQLIFRLTGSLLFVIRIIKGDLG